MGNRAAVVTVAMAAMAKLTVAMAGKATGQAITHGNRTPGHHPGLSGRSAVTTPPSDHP